MEGLFVDKSVEIKAPVSRVWEVLTSEKYTALWAPEFMNGAPFHIESTWKVGEDVLWKDEHGKTTVKGTVTALEFGELLRFTVFDVSMPSHEVDENDGITYIFTVKDGVTTLHILQGDFSTIADGEKYHKMTEATWDRVLPIVKWQAESL